MDLLCKIKPINGNIIVIDDKNKEQTDSGIYIPTTTKSEKIVSGMVVSVSKNKDKHGNYMEQEVEAGDFVLYDFHAGAGNSFNEEGRIIRVVRSIEILAVIEDGE